MTHHTEPIIVDADIPDGSRTPVNVFPGGERPLVVLWPGFGVGASYYRPIAAELAARGFPSAIGELRGQGASTARAGRHASWGYFELATEDYRLVIEAAKAELGLDESHPTVLLTHSLGGQVATAFLALDDAPRLGVAGLFGVGSGSPYFRTFEGNTRVRIRVGASLFALGNRLFGHWPGAIAGIDPVGYGRQPARLMADWRHLALHNSFEHVFDGHGVADHRAALAGVESPVLFTRFENDEMCPLASSQALAGHLPNAEVGCEELPGRLGHNRWAREPQIVADRFERFLAENGI